MEVFSRDSNRIANYKNKKIPCAVHVISFLILEKSTFPQKFILTPPTITKLLPKTRLLFKIVPIPFS